MKIDPVSMLFEDFSPTEEADMLSLARALVLDQNMPEILPTWVELWIQKFGFEDRKMLILATVFSEKVLLSIIQNGGKKT